MPERARRPARDESAWSDSRLVKACLAGDEDAWAGLVDKYKNLIFSIPVRRGFSQDDAADVFQRVCLLLLAELASLRKAEALPMWLIRVTSHECSAWQRRERHHAELPEGASAGIVLPPEAGDPQLDELRHEQALHEALATLAPRCQRLIRLLFFEPKARPYREVAELLGVAAGSIGFIRGRCLAGLRRRLEAMGF
ncbi:MAG: RNA polymerase sigma factor [Vicinamibacteria bacterium]